MGHNPQRPTWEQSVAAKVITSTKSRKPSDKIIVTDDQLGAIRELIRDRCYADAIARIDTIRAGGAL